MVFFFSFIPYLHSHSICLVPGRWTDALIHLVWPSQLTEVVDVGEHPLSFLPNQSSSFLLPWSLNVCSPIYTLQLSIANPMCNYYTSIKKMEINGGEVFFRVIIMKWETRWMRLDLRDGLEGVGLSSSHSVGSTSEERGFTRHWLFWQLILGFSFLRRIRNTFVYKLPPVCHFATEGPRHPSLLSFPSQPIQQMLLTFTSLLLCFCIYVRL